MSKLLLLSDSAEVFERFTKWFDARSVSHDLNNPRNINFHIGLSELHYLFRVPVFSDQSLPHLAVVPHDIIEHIAANPHLLTRGTLIAGLPGAGKTNTLKRILSGLSHSYGHCLFICDIKGEYAKFCTVNGITFLPAGQRPSCLKELGVNIFIPSRNLRLSSHIEVLSSLFSIAGAGGAGILLNQYFKLFIQEFYLTILWNNLDKSGLPSNTLHLKLSILDLSGGELEKRLGGDYRCLKNTNELFLNFWQSNSQVFLDNIFSKTGHRSNSRVELFEVMSVRFSFFKTSVLQYFDYENGRSIDALLNKKICISFQGFSRSTLQLLMSSFCLLGFETILSGDETEGRLKYLWVLEEAHTVASKQVESAEVIGVERLVSSIIERGLTEGRSKGLGIICTDQQPGTRLMASILANTNTKIAHSLLGADSQLMAEAMGIQGTNMSNLGVGEAFVKLGNEGLPAFRSKVRL